MGCAAGIVRDGLQDRPHDGEWSMDHEQGQSIDRVSEQHGLESATWRDVHLPRGGVKRLVRECAIRAVCVACALVAVRRCAVACSSASWSVILSSPAHHLRLLVSVMGLFAASVVACDGMAPGNGGSGEVVVDGDYFEARIEPCASASGDFDPCDPDRDVEFQGFSQGSSVLPDRPYSLEEVLFNSWGVWDLDEVPNWDLVSATHIVARGRFEEDSLVCQGFPVLFPAWSLDYADLGIPEPEPGQPIHLGPTVSHWMCFARLQVHEYMVGKGGASVTVLLASAGIPYYDEAEFEAPESHTLLEMHRKAVSDHFVGPEGVVWLAPSYSAAVESWMSYSLWGVQRGEDGIVRVISPDAKYYENVEDLEYDDSHLMAPLDEFRQLIADADSSRRERTSGRIGVGADTPMMVQDALRLSDYYQEIGAYDHPTIPPMRPPNAR